MTEEYLDNDSPILGQGYVCLSFISPETMIKQKEMFTFHQYMTNKFKEYAETIDRSFEKNKGDESESALKKLEYCFCVEPCLRNHQSEILSV